MATNKQLTVKLNLNAKQFERKINSVNKAVNNLNKFATKQAKLYNDINLQLTKTEQKTNRVKSATQGWANAQKEVSKGLKGHSSLLGTLAGKLKRLAGTYLGVMGTKYVANTTDTLIGAQNKLNFVNAQSLGSAGTNKNGTYSQATLDLTQQSLDKMYASAQKVRTSYTGMMANVSKTMTLAGGAFDNNIDNAIRFQEIMAEAYAVGGASAEEMSTSMYQLTQALGAGTLAGDELRSVREGAPLAYQAIEKFAQGIYDTTDSLKDMASQGKITSDIVVAAIMKEGQALDNAFKQTKQTFGQTFEQIKSSAVYAFQPVMEMLSNALSNAVENGMVEKFETLFTNISKAIMIVFTLLMNLRTAVSGVFGWIAENITWLSKSLLTIGTVVATFVIPQFIQWFTLTIKNLVATLALLWSDITGFIALAKAEGLAATMAGLFGITINWWLIAIIAVIAGVIIAVIWMADSFQDACGMIVGGIYWVFGVIYNIIAIIVNVTVGLGKVFIYTAHDILAALNNAFQGAKIKFWEWVQDCLNGTSKVAKAVSKIAELFGLDSVSIDAKINSAKGKMEEAYDDSLYRNAFSTMELKDLNEMYNKGYDWGFEKSTNLTNKLGGLGDKLGLDLSAISGDFPNANDPAYDVTNGYNQPTDLLAEIADNTGSMADSMDVSNEDLEYLRRLATQRVTDKLANVTVNVEMTNNNNVNKDFDLRSIAIGLKDMVEEEMFAAVDGVYGY